nr:MAG TPA: sixteen heme cytochrome TRANSPORT [Caudoviricetes sp.]
MEKKKFLRRSFTLVLAALMLLAFVSFMAGLANTTIV